MEERLLSTGKNVEREERLKAKKREWYEGEKQCFFI